MPYKRKIYKSGNSDVVSIPPVLLKELGIGVGDEVLLTKIHNRIQIQPAKKAEELSLDEKLKRVRALAGIIDPGKDFDFEKLIKDMEEEYGR